MTLTTIAVLSGPLLLVPLGSAVLELQAPVLAAGAARRPAVIAGSCGQKPLATGAPAAVVGTANFWPQLADGGLGQRFVGAARRWRLRGGAAAAVIAAMLPTGAPAGVAAGGWLAVAAWMVIDEVWRWWREGRHVVGLPALVAWGWLPVAAGWFAASRAGIAPLGFGEPITLLTAAHFHVAGFGLSVLASTAAFRLGRRRLGQVAWAAWGLVTVGPVCVATGFTADEPALNMVGAFVVAVGVFALCPCLIAATDAGPPAARWAGRLAAVVPLVPMVLAVVYSLGPVLGTPAPSIELMVRAHGIVNALGFVGLGLLAFVLIGRRERRTGSKLHEEVLDAVVA